MKADPSPIQTSGEDSKVDAPAEDRVEARDHGSRIMSALFFPEYIGLTKYKLTRRIGSGGNGVVFAAENIVTGERVAIKRILDSIRTGPLAKRVVHELKLLRHLSKHENIIQVKDVLLPNDLDRFVDTFVVFELMGSDLSGILNRTRLLSKEHVRYFMFQLLRGVTFMHRSRVAHRNLEPKSIFINSDCALRIGKLEVARLNYQDRQGHEFWNEYCFNIWYKAPEVLLEDTTQFSTSIDIWSVGCIFAEMLMGSVLFRGKSLRNQLERFTHVLGTAPKTFKEKLRMADSRRAMRHLGQRSTLSEEKSLRDRLLGLDVSAVNLLEGMLKWDPTERISAEEALSHQYFDVYRYLGDGAAAGPVLSLDSFLHLKDLSHEKLRLELIKEILQYNPEKIMDIAHITSPNMASVTPVAEEQEIVLSAKPWLHTPDINK